MTSARIFRICSTISYWARDRVLDAVAVLTPEQYTRDLGNSFKSIRDTLVHSYSAEWVWYIALAWNVADRATERSRIIRTCHRSRRPGASSKQECARSSETSTKRRSTRVHELSLA